MVEIKANLDGIYIKADRGLTFESFFSKLQQLILTRQGAYDGFKLLGIMGPNFSYGQKARIESLLEEYTKIEILSLESFEPDQKSNLREKLDACSIENLELKEKIKDQEEDVKLARQELNKLKTESECDRVRFHFGTLRSGNSISHKGHVIVVGDVNRGAEVIAGGNIIVIGKANGLFHAGYLGDENTFILASSLSPVQIRIARFVSTPPPNENKNFEIVYLENGNIIIKKVN